MAVTLFQRKAQFTLSIASFSKQDLFFINNAAEGLLLQPLMKTPPGVGDCTKPGKVHSKGCNRTQRQQKHDTVHASKSDKTVPVSNSCCSNAPKQPTWKTYGPAMSMFHLSCRVNRHKCRIWGKSNPAEILNHKRDSPKLFDQCAMSN